MRHGSLPLSQEQFAVAVIGDPENCALVGIAERQCDHLGGKRLRRGGKYAPGFEQLCNPLANDAHA